MHIGAADACSALGGRALPPRTPELAANDDSAFHVRRRFRDHSAGVGNGDLPGSFDSDELPEKILLAGFCSDAGCGFHENVVVYWLLIGAQTSARYYRGYREQEKAALLLRVEAAELETQLTASRLGALEIELQPHFLFNTLNAIVVLVRQGKTEAAEEMLTRLSDLLRAILDDAEAQEVPLRRELECLNLYLGIEKVRFGDRLETVFRVETATLDAAVPHMSLQPLVENAVRHGVSRRAAAGCIKISAQRVNGHLEICIVDNGPGPDVESGAANMGALDEEYAHAPDTAIW